MNFEIRDGKERLPDEEDIYGVNDIEERDRLNALFGGPTQEQRIRRRRVVMRLFAVLVVLAFAGAFGVPRLLHMFGW